MASTILEDYIYWGIIGPGQSDIGDIDWSDAYKRFQEQRDAHYKAVDVWYTIANLTEEDEFYTIDAYNEWVRNRDIFSFKNDPGVAKVMWESLIGKSLTQEQYDDYISALSNMMESLKLLFMVVDRDPFTEVTTTPPVDVPDGFKTVWRVDSGQQIVLPLPSVDNNDTSLIYNFTVYWGDNSSNTITSFDDSDITHTYTTSGDKTVTIVGDCEGWSFSNSTSKLELIQVLSWGDPTLFSGFKYLRFLGTRNLTSLPDGSDGYGTSIRANGSGCSSFEGTFYDCSSLTSIPDNLFDTHSLVTSFQQTFLNCSSLTSIPAGLFDTNTEVTSFNQTFYGCSSLTSIPDNLFDTNTEVTDFTGIFRDCTGLLSIPDNLFDTNILVTNFQQTFFNCNGLTSIPTDLFINNTQVQYFNFTFESCTGLTSIPDNLFDTNTLVTNFFGTFQGCTGLASIPTGLFDANTLVTNFNNTFSGCTGLTLIPTGLFINNTLVTTFQDTFGGCYGLTSIPPGLFDTNTLVNYFVGTFGGCYGLTSIPDNLFDNNTNVTTFQSTFYNCTNLGSIPDNLFDTNILVTNFQQTFFNCNGLTSIPTDLFINNTQVQYFDGIFYGCYGLTSIPTDLFRYNTSVQSFNYTFYNCYGLTSIPTGLFKYNLSATSFQYTFQYCNNLTFNEFTFYDTGEESTRFAGKDVNFYQCFDRNSFTGTQGTAPDLWNCSFSSVNSGLCFAGPGNDSTSISNYVDIPAGWK